MFMQTMLRKSLVVSGLALGAALMNQHAIAAPGDSLRWQSVIGIAQPNNVVGSGTGAATGGAVPWSTQEGNATVLLNKGKVMFDVHGLALAGGNAIGTPGPVLQV